MGPFLAYTFTSGVYLLALYLVYKPILADEKQASFNRIVLLCIYALSFLLPLVPFGPHIQLSADSGLVTLEAPSVTLAKGSVSASTGTVFRILMAVYLAGAAFVSVLTIRSMLRLKRLIASGTRSVYGDYTVVRVSGKYFAPLSWGRFIVVSDAESMADLDLIICHETTHIRCRHYLDLLFGQTVCMVLWYNPASWLMLSELKSAHEYQADESVLNSGADIHRYQMLLIKKAVGARFPFLANSLNHSNLKKRITMMLKSKTKPVRRLRVLAAVPAVALAAMLLAVPAVNSAVNGMSSSRLIPAETIAESKVTNSAETMQVPVQSKSESEPEAVENPEVTPRYPGGEGAMFGALCKEVKYPEESYKNKVQGRVVVGFIVGTDGTLSDFKILKSVDPLLDAEALRAAKTLNIKWTPGTTNGKPVACKFALPVSFKLQ